MIRFNCPHCDRPYEVPDALARLPLVCKQCGQRITPPAPTPNAPPPPAAVQPPKPAAPVAPPPPAPKPAPTAAPATAPKPAVPVAKPAATAAPQPAAAPAVPVAKPASAPVAPAATAKSVPAPKPAPPPDGNGAPVVEPDPARSVERNGEHAPAPEAEAEPKTDDSVDKINLDLLPKPVPTPPPEEPPEAKLEPTMMPFLADLGVFVVLVLVGLLLGEQLVGKPTGQVLSEAGSATKFPPLDLLLWGGPALVFGLVYLLLNSRELTVGAWLRRRNANAE